MKKPFLNFLNKNVAPHFEEGGKLHSAYYLWEAVDGFLYTHAEQTKGPSHLRDAMDLKRMMITVFWALMPAVFMAMYNTGYQANLVLAKLTEIPDGSWQRVVMGWIGLGFDPSSILSNLIHGMLYFARCIS